ncbi:MAG: hypothetical protein QM426_02605 [Euryarchaeota archaeon]|nr:hypothetical protein [Euryarchaeota archaeon]
MILLASASLAMGHPHPDPNADAHLIVSAAVGATAGDGPVIKGMFVLGDDDPEEEGTQIMPLPGEGNEKSYKTFYKYAIVSDPNGIADIAAVYQKLNDENGNRVIRESLCTDITGNPEEWNAVLDEAWKASLISDDELAEYKYGLNDAKKQLKIFKAENSLSNCNPAGVYEAYFKAVDSYGLFYEDRTYFEYLPLKAIGLDFSSINYGAVGVNLEKWISGDENWATPEKPTIKNQGNVPLQVSVQGFPMRGENLKQRLTADSLSVELLGQFVYGLAEPVTMEGFLQPCTPTQISFGIKVPLGTAADNYSGDITIDIVGEHDDDHDHDDDDHVHA